MSGKQLLNPLPLSFSASRTHTLAVLLQGGTVYFHPVIFSAGELADAILTRRVDSVCAVPTIVRGLIELTDQRSSPLFEGLSAFYCFGAPMLPQEKLQAKAGLCSMFVQEYVSSICGRITSLEGADIEARPESVGRVLPHVALQIVDEEDRVLPRGESGAIRLRSPGMARTTSNVWRASCRSVSRSGPLRTTARSAEEPVAFSVDMSMIGFCLDTCHAHAGGEELATVVDRVKAITGRIDLVHCNDSRDEFDSGADRHANIGEGKIDPDDIVTVVRAAGAPVVCETPGGADGQASDIAWLRKELG
jgi:acyl-CoA synthetase (AMP-forming)/AMP-acid ligase II